MSLIDDLTWCDRHDVEGSLCYERGYPLEQCVKGTRLVLDPTLTADGPVILLPDGRAVALMGDDGQWADWVPNPQMMARLYNAAEKAADS